MAEKVWIRDYAEKAGASVDWDQEAGMVVIDGTYRLWPDEVSEGKSYIDKRVIDAALRYLGYTPPDEAPDTSKETDKQKDREDYERYWEDRAGRSIPGWDEIKDYIYQHAYKPIRDWVLENIWEPILDWVQPFVHSIRTIISSLGDLWSSFWGFLGKLRCAILDSARAVKEALVDYTSPVVDWVKDKIDYIEWYIKHDVITSVNSLVYYRDRFVWLVATAFEQLVTFIDSPVSVISESIVAGFELWGERVFSLVEGYIIEHWDDDVQC